MELYRYHKSCILKIIGNVSLTTRTIFFTKKKKKYTSRYCLKNQKGSNAISYCFRGESF